MSIIIPTYRRPDNLRRALESIFSQQTPVSEVIIGVRDTDNETRKALAAFPNFSGVVISTVTVPGVIASMQSALDKSTGDIVAIMDDDVELLPDWTQRVVEHFQTYPKLGLLGGRDLLQDNLVVRAAEPRQAKVGIHSWYGSSTGNHHCGIGGYRVVDGVKGCNIAGRGQLLRGIGFEAALRGQGAQVHWEIAFCLDVQASDYQVAYDSELQVKHFVGPRFDTDINQRGGYSGEALYDEVFNMQYCCSTRLPWWRAVCSLLWSLLRGSRQAPGLIQYLRIKFIRRDPNANNRLCRVFKGTWDGALAAWRKTHSGT